MTKQTIEQRHGGRELMLKAMRLRELGPLLESVQLVTLTDDRQIAEPAGPVLYQGDLAFDLLRGFIVAPDDDHYLGDTFRFPRDEYGVMHLTVEVGATPRGEISCYDCRQVTSPPE